MSNEKQDDEAIRDIDSLSDEDALDVVGRLIDNGLDTGSPKATTYAFEMLEALEGRDLSPAKEALIHYFRANAWENRRHENNKKHSWEWEEPNLENQVLELRRASRHPGFGDLDEIRRCQILTNLANCLSSVGRAIEAIEYWDAAISIQSTFAMALGNRGYGLIAYANALYDPGHSSVMRLAASDAFTAASSETALYESQANEPLRERFAELGREVIEGINSEDARRILDGTQFSVGTSDAERAYRNWVLDNKLFINPLNDLGSRTVAAQDVLTLPSLVQAPDTKASPVPPPIYGLFNQLKQEFASARYLYFEGRHANDPHFSDKDVLLYNTLDYPSYGLAIEKVRMAYRVAYSLFDKVSFLLNHYFNVGWRDDQVTFRKLWYRHHKNKKSLREMFVDRPNWALRGLFWLAKDLHEPEFKKVTEPDAEALADIRNHLEHKYLQIHESWVADIEPQGDNNNALSRQLTRAEFEAKALRVLKLSRASLIYVATAIHCEENLRHEGGSGATKVGLPLGAWEDAWKV